MPRPFCYIAVFHLFFSFIDYNLFNISFCTLLVSYRLKPLIAYRWLRYPAAFALAASAVPYCQFRCPSAGSSQKPYHSG
jgi:hypothetical protein